MKKILIGFVALSMMFCVGCGEKVKLANDTSYDLTEKGIPATVMAPGGAEITESIIAEIATYSIKKEDFGIDVTFDNEPYASLSEELADQISYAEEDDTFVEFISKTDNGFIVKVDYDGEESHEFFYIAEKDGNQITITHSLKLFGGYSLEDAQLMYSAAESIKFN